MHRTRDTQQTDLFDPWAFLGQKQRQLLQRSWAQVFREHLLVKLPVGEFARHFSPQTGRPTKDLYVACGVLILQQLHDLTDAATVEALALNIAWHYALDLRDPADAYLCEKTLRNYRRLMIEHELDQLLFRELTDELIRAFGVDTTRQRLDSTAVRSAMRSLTRLGTVVETISKFLRELARTHPELHQRVDRDLVRRHVERRGEGCFADTTPSESQRRLPEAAEDLLRLSVIFEPTEAAKLPSFVILQRVLHEQFQVMVSEDDGDDPPTPQPDLITHVSLHKMTVHDSQCLEPAMEDVQVREVSPQQVLADTHYGSNDHQHTLAEQGVELISPAMAPKGSKQGRLTLEQFQLDDQNLITRCPAGYEPIATSRGPEKLQARFDISACCCCSLRDQCPVWPNVIRGGSARYQYTPARAAMRTRRLQDQTDQFRAIYRWRAGIEATMSRLKHQMHLARLRVRGWAAISCRVFLRALGLNIHRCATRASV